MLVVSDRELRDFKSHAIVSDYLKGGGRGIRVVRSPDTLEESISSARQEALSAFGDGSIFLERLVSHTIYSNESLKLV